jgi:hypothetical protein
MQRNIPEGFLPRRVPGCRSTARRWSRRYRGSAASAILKRQQLLELGEPAIRYLTEIVHCRPRQWFEDVDRLHGILQRHGPEVLRRAMEEALKRHIFGALYVERLLEPGLKFPEVLQ